MESDKIERLLNKYFEANTTLAEEQVLRDYFSGKKVAPHLEKYVGMFQYFSQSKQESYTRRISLPKTGGSIKGLYRWIAAAAVIILFMGLYFGQRSTNTSLENEYTQEEIASAQEAFSLFAQNFNKGTKQLSYLEEFEKNTNRFLIKE